MAIETNSEIRKMAGENNEAENMTEEEKAEEIKSYEGDILSAIMEAASFKESKSYKQRVVRNGVALLEFSIRPLSEDEYNKCRTQNTKFKYNKSLGIRVAEKVDQIRYRSALIYEATIPEDRKRIWDNKQAWELLDVATGVDTVDKMLMAGEKARLCEQIDEISGYGDELEDTIKN